MSLFLFLMTNIYFVIIILFYFIIYFVGKICKKYNVKKLLLQFNNSKIEDWQCGDQSNRVIERENTKREETLLQRIHKSPTRM